MMSTAHTHWWETVGPNGLPRFYVFCTGPSSMRKRSFTQYKHINVVELTEDAEQLPHTYRSKLIKRVLLRTVPLSMRGENSKGASVLRRAERVTNKLTSMHLSVMAVEQEKKGVNDLFDKLWLEDCELNPDVNPRRS